MKQFYIILIVCLSQICCSKQEDFKVLREISGPYQTNCYLIYGTSSKDAALIDPGWQIDTLVSFIRNNGLNLKYIFITHGHSDHYYYVPELKKQFPKARWCLNKIDYEKIVKCPDWALRAYGQEWIVDTRKNSEESVYLDFNPESAGIPDIFVEGDETFKVGSLKIKTLNTPGHSPGGICYYTGNIIFSGDQLFYRSVGNLDKLTSNTEDFKKSVRELYRMFPDPTIVYPGHGQVTDIGSEKRENKRISLHGGLETWWHLE
jgi:hydroxyacylglutathione hydrolase